MIDSATDTQVWAEKYSGDLSNVFELQARISRCIVEALQVSLTVDETRRLTTRPTTDTRVYDAWLRARHDALSLTAAGVERALRLTTQAIETVGDDALLHATAAFLKWAAYDFGVVHDDVTLVAIEHHAKRAIDLNPDLALAWLVLGLAHYRRGDIHTHVRHLRRSLALERNSDALTFLAFVLGEIGRIDEARTLAAEAVAIDPLTWFSHLPHAAVELFDGAVDVALQRFRESVTRLAPREPFPLWWLAQAAAYARRDAEAIDIFGRVADAGPGFLSDSALLCRAALSGNRAEVHRVLDTTNLRALGRTDEYYPCLIANCLAHVGETDEALTWVEQAISWGFTNHRFLSEHNRFLAPLHGNAGFQRAIRRAQLDERTFQWVSPPLLFDSSSPPV